MPHSPDPNRKFLLAAALVLVAVASGRGFLKAQSDKQLLQFTTPRSVKAWEVLSKNNDSEAQAQWKRLNAVWADHGKRDVSSELVPFLSSPSPPLYIRAARALGRMESPAAQAPLETLLQSHKSEPFVALPLQLALGRIKSRGLGGQAKVETMTREVGLSWNETVRLSELVNARNATRRQMRATPGADVVAEAVDMLVSMQKSGQNVTSLVDQLTLSGPQRARLGAVRAGEVESARPVLDRLIGLYVIRDENYEEAESLTQENAAVPDLLLSYMRDMKLNPKKYYGMEPYPGYAGAFRQKHGYTFLFRLATQTEDERLLPYFRYFLHNTQSSGPTQWVNHEAEMALQNYDLREKKVLDVWIPPNLE